MFLTAEWQCWTMLAGLVASLLVTSSSPWPGLGLLAFFGVMISLTAGAAATAGWYACQDKKWNGRAARGGAAGRLLAPRAADGSVRMGPGPRRCTRGAPALAAGAMRLGNLEQARTLARPLGGARGGAGGDCREAGSHWDTHDLEVRGPGPYRVYLRSVAERLEKGWFHAAGLRPAASHPPSS